MRVFLVSHFHWDREWYRTMQSFRARLVDALDAVLDLAEDDADYRFLLDGQTVVLEDYLAVRPDREADLRRHVGEGRLGIGPWYVQPDSLLPSGESHVRNLLVGRQVGERFGAVSTSAYVPDSFGHPAQLPELFDGFGLDGFVYWRGNSNEIDRLGSRWRWQSPGGSSVRALLLSEGYFCAGRPDRDVATAVDRLASMVDKLKGAGESPVILMNGADHTGPDLHVAELTEALGERLGCKVERALLDEVVRAAPEAESLPSFVGDLVGGRKANLLPGVWSARIPLKIRNRRVETALQCWAEPWAALGAVLGLADERASLTLAWRNLLQNQAHDSICGCSIDATHDRMEARFDDAEGLAEETTTRVLERLAGRPADRSVPDSEAQWVTVFNPSPHPRSDRVRVALDGEPSMTISLGEPSLHSLTMAALDERGYSVDGSPAKVGESSDPRRVRWIPGQRAVDVEFVATDVPAFGCRTFAIQPAAAAPEIVDRGTSIEADDISAEVASDGTITARFGETSLPGLFAVEDIGDRGDSYDFDPVGEAFAPSVRDLDVTRRRHSSGIETLIVRRRLEVPASLDEEREERATSTVTLELTTELCVAPGVGRIDARVRLTNRARDHRLRLRFPHSGEVSRYSYVTTFDVAQRAVGTTDDKGWMHPAPTTFCHQGWVEANGLTVLAPGLPEAEVTRDAIALTLVRSVGWLARFDLRTRPIPAGPAMPAAGAQTLGEVVTDLALMWQADPSAARAASAGLRGVLAGPTPILAPGTSLLSLEGEGVVLSALKPAQDGDGFVVRVQNPTDTAVEMVLRIEVPVEGVVPTRLDETPTDAEVSWDGETARATVVAHGLLSVRVRTRLG